MPKPEQKALIEQAIAEIKKKKEFDKDAGGLLASIEEGLVKAIGPALEKALGGMSKSISGLKVDAPNVQMPEMEIDMAPVADAIREAMKEAVSGLKINVPEIKLPTINVPEVKLPTFNIPAQTVSEVSLKGVDSRNPLAVLLHGTDGKPIMNFGGGGSKANFLTIKNILTTNGDSVMDDVNDAIKVNVVTGSITSSPGLQISGASDSVNVVQYGGVDVALNSGVASAGTLRIVHATDVGMSVNIIGGSSSGTQYSDNDVDDVVTGTAVMFKASNALNSMMVVSGNDPLPITFGTSVEVKQVSGFVNSVEIASQPFTLDVKQVSGSVSSVEIASQPFTLDTKQVSGGNDSVNVVTFNSVVPAAGLNETTTGFLRVVQPTDFTGSVNVVALNGTAPSLGLNETNAGFLRVVQPTDFTGSVNLVTLNGIAPNLGAGAVSTGTLRVVVGNDSTTMVVGNVVADAADDGSAPHKIGGIARQANPAAVAANDRVSATYDDLGRQVMRVNQVRDLIQTAYVALSTGTEATLLASASGVFSDLIYIMGANDSSAAVQVDIRAATGANKIMTIEIPANGTAGVSLPVPIPQDVAADTWTVDMPDITGTNVYISALFSKEV